MTALVLASFLVLLPAREALSADLRVRVYIAGGIIVGGASIFWAITIGGGDFCKKEKNKDKKKSPAMFAYNEAPPELRPELREEDYSRAGLIKILEW